MNLRYGVRREREPELRYWFLLKEERAMWKVLAADDEAISGKPCRS